MMPLYAVTLFASALLLFLVQPMVGKMILPALGGTPAVWNTCMVFFQATLLAGYAYAHWSTRWLDIRRQAGLHLGVLLLPLAALPISVAAGAQPPSTDLPIGWLLARLLAGAGLPFFVVSSTAPLLQKWFARTGHDHARDPYFLYAASNAGSLLALLGYPLIVEPRLGLDAQSRLWTWGYAGLVALIAACAAVLWLVPTAVPRTGETEPARSPGRVTLGERMGWIFLAAIPSSLMLGVTTYITTDLAAVPLMWVLPLAIYLLTFVLVFARRPPIPHALVGRVLPFVVLPMGVLFFFRPDRAEWVMVPGHLLAFFLATMLCHGELVRRRPDPSRLTEFYLLMSLGGVLGGAFNAMVAPQVFTRVYEYPLAMALVCFVLPRPAAGRDTAAERRGDRLVPLAVATVCGGALALLHAVPQAWLGRILPLFFVAVALICFSFKERPIRLGLCYAVMLACVGTLADWRTGEVVHAERNFFGVKQVVNDTAGRLRLLVHGNTTHGCQNLDAGKADQPSAYYHRTGPIGDLFAAGTARGGLLEAGIVGLGTGAVAAYARPGEHFTFYEIDPAVERIARDPRYFSFLANCRGRCDVVLGDGRLALAKAPPGRFSLLLLDAFSSDSVPTHLLSREAIELYVGRLADGGLLAFHVSNRFFDFEPLLGRAAEEAGLSCVARFDREVSREDRQDGKLASHCVVMARSPMDLRELAVRPGWHAVSPRPGTCAWSDQYCDVVGLFLAGRTLNLGPRTAVARPR